jgi:hypothetical protein
MTIWQTVNLGEEKRIMSVSASDQKKLTERDSKRP